MPKPTAKAGNPFSNMVKAGKDLKKEAAASKKGMKKGK